MQSEFKIKSAMFLTSAADIETYKKIRGEYSCPEVCVAGRSNAGKSSFINMLANQKKLAFSSATPGRTRLINLFLFNSGEFLMTDLPGYGYAKASKSEQTAWSRLMENYFSQNENLKRVFVLVDSRHEPAKSDKTMLSYLYKIGLPFTVLATKADKLSKAQLSRNIQVLASDLGIGKDNIIAVSALTRLNREKIETLLSEILQ